jgi:PEGA domain-containing protein
MFIAAAAMVFVALAAPSQAQGHGHGGAHGRAVVVVGGSYYAPYDPFFYADPWYGYQYPYPPYAYAYHPIAPDSSVRLEVKPKNAEVYVDGYYAGIVDDFDGTFQRLRVEPGEHEIELWLDGFKTVRQKVYLTPDNTFRIKYSMEPLGGQAQEPKPQPLQPQGGYQPRMEPPPMQQQPGQGPSTRRAPLPPPPQQPPPDERRGGQPGNQSYGTLAIRVQPGDAEVSIDGEAWRGPAGGDRLIVDVPEGSHTVEIRKAGYRTYVTQIDVRRGQSTPLNVSLRGEQP